MIEFKNVSFRYSNFQIQNISFSVKKGEILAVTGNNASGKTTLIKLISGILKTKRGEINLNGKPIKDGAAKVGVVFQNPDNQIIFNKVYDDIAFTLKNNGINKEEYDERIDYALSLVNMTEYKNAETFTMSSGQKQRIALANMLAITPDIMIFDEASAYLDPTNKEALYAMWAELKKRGITVIFTTNAIEEIVYADRVLVLNDGQLKADLTTPEMVKNLDIFRELNTFIPLKLKLIEQLNLASFSDADILAAIRS